MSYASFKREVMERSGHECEAVGCSAVPDGVHHILKRSRYPHLAEEPLNGVALCGPCHAELERRERAGEPTREMLPERRWEWAEGKARPEDAGRLGRAR